VAKSFKKECLAAIAFLKKHKWIRDDESDGEGGFCMIGALYEVGADTDAIERLHQSIYGDDIPTFNDEQANTKKDVYKRLKELSEYKVLDEETMQKEKIIVID
jgi:hypothetical protein